MILAILLMGCGDAELEGYRASLSAYDRGRAALEAARPAEAANLFAEAATFDPASPELPVWQARALVEAGDPAGAEGVLAAALERFPDEVTARYNHAAVLSRLGELDAAAEELSRLYASGAVEPAEVGEDPDFAALAADPRYQQLAPPQRVAVALVGEPGAVLLGEDWTLEIEVRSRQGELLAFSDLGETTGLLRHVRTVEDLDPVGGREQRRTLTVTWKAVAPGLRTLGPWLVAAGGQSTVTGTVPVEVLALPGRAPGVPDEAGSVFSVESALAGTTAPWAGRLLGRLAVRLPPDATATLAPAPAEPPTRLELRRAGQTEQLALLYRDAAATQVTIRRGPAALLQADVP